MMNIPGSVSDSGLLYGKKKGLSKRDSLMCGEIGASALQR